MQWVGREAEMGRRSLEGEEGRSRQQGKDKFPMLLLMRSGHPAMTLL